MSLSDDMRAQRTPFQEGETVLMIEPRGKKHFVPLEAGGKFHHIRTGHLLHDKVIGASPGICVLSEDKIPVICLRLTFEDFILKGLKRRTSIIHPKDLASVLVRGNLFSGARVLEAGLGSGAASLLLLRYLGPDGQLVSYERRPEFIEPALRNIRRAHRLFGDPGAQHEVVEGDVYEENDKEDLDLVLLDLPEPQRALESAHNSLRPGGTLLCWLPTVTQVYFLVRELQRGASWGVVETRELLERNWEVAENAMRPYHRMVGHTGFLIRARRLEDHR